MREMQNRPSVRPAYIMVAQATNPIPLGATGLWFDGVAIKAVSSDGSIVTLASSTAIKAAVRLATAAPLPASTYSGTAETLTANVNGALGTAIDTTAAAVGDRVLVKDQAAGSQNGIYTVTSLGSAGTKWKLTRAVDFDSSAQIKAGLLVEINEGASLADKLYRLTTNDPIVLDTTALVFALVA